jgi:predicted nucleotidyltransferase
MNKDTSHFNLAVTISDQFSTYPFVEAIGLGGSSSTGSTDAASDIDLYVFTRETIPLIKRAEIVNNCGASRVDLDLNFWDPGDEWFDAQTGIEVDITYWNPNWIESKIERVLIQHQSSLGYSTCHWHTLSHTSVLFDRTGWLTGLITKCSQPYPEVLSQTIIKHNYPVLRDVIPSYTTQIEKAIKRQDLVSVNHRVAALLASYFDIIFAVNRVPHPGEKRLLQLTPRLCKVIPTNMVIQVERLLKESSTADGRLIETINELIDGLDKLLSTQSFNPFSNE